MRPVLEIVNKLVLWPSIYSGLIRRQSKRAILLQVELLYSVRDAGVVECGPEEVVQMKPLNDIRERCANPLNRSRFNAFDERVRFFHQNGKGKNGARMPTLMPTKKVIPPYSYLFTRDCADSVLFRGFSVFGSHSCLVARGPTAIRGFHSWTAFLSIMRSCIYIFCIVHKCRFASG